MLRERGKEEMKICPKCGKTMFFDDMPSCTYCGYVFENRAEKPEQKKETKVNIDWSSVNVRSEERHEPKKVMPGKQWTPEAPAEENPVRSEPVPAEENDDIAEFEAEHEEMPESDDIAAFESADASEPPEQDEPDDDDIAAFENDLDDIGAVFDEAASESMEDFISEEDTVLLGGVMPDRTEPEEADEDILLGSVSMTASSDAPEAADEPEEAFIPDDDDSILLRDVRSHADVMAGLPEAEDPDDDFGYGDDGDFSYGDDDAEAEYDDSDEDIPAEDTEAADEDDEDGDDDDDDFSFMTDREAKKQARLAAKEEKKKKKEERRKKKRKEKDEKETEENLEEIERLNREAEEEEEYDEPETADYDSTSPADILFMLLSLLVPPVGIVLAFVFAKRKQRQIGCLLGAFFGLATIVAVGIILGGSPFYVPLHFTEAIESIMP